MTPVKELRFDVDVNVGDSSKGPQQSHHHHDHDQSPLQMQEGYLLKFDPQRPKLVREEDLLRELNYLLEMMMGETDSAIVSSEIGCELELSCPSSSQSQSQSSSSLTKKEEK